MNFICSGDWHIKISPRIPREWQLGRYRALFSKILELCHEHQADLILTGDIADSSRPNLDELSLLLEFFEKLKHKGIVTILVSGNHENVSDTSTLYDYLNVERVFDFTINYTQKWYNYGSLNFLALNHNEIRGYNFEDNYKNLDRHTILLSHFRCNVNDYIREEIDVASVASKFDAIIASDIHQGLTVEGNVHYTNHPLNSSFEQNPECGLILLSAKSDSNIERIPLHLPNLIKHDCEAKDFDALVQSLDPFDYHKVCVKGTPAELRAIPNTFPQGFTEKTVIMDEVTFELDSGATEEKEEKSEGATDDLVKYARRLGWGEEQVKRMVEIMEEV